MKNKILFSAQFMSFVCCVFVLSSVLFAQSEPGPPQAGELKGTDPKKAASLYNKYVKDNPMASDAAQAKFQEGLCYEAVGDYYKAYKAYQHIIDNYPLYPQTDELLDRQYRIGNYYLLVATQPKGANPFKIFFHDNEKAVEIFSQVVKNAPFTEIGAKAQYRLGFAHMQMKEYIEAVDEFIIILEKYPGSGFVDDATYGLASSYFNLVQGPEYDKYSTEKSIEYFNRYINEYPHGRYAGEVMPKVNKMNQDLAKGIYLIGNFYEKQYRYEAALVYYDDLERRYGDTFFAEKARAKRSVLEGIVKSELPYRSINQNYRDAIGVYYAIRRKDTRNPWEFWKRDPLTPEERGRLNWARQLIEIAKQHRKEAKVLFDTEKKLIILELKIRDLKKETQRLKAQLPIEHAVLDQLNSGVVPEDTQQNLMPDWLYSPEERKDLKRLQRKQRIHVRNMENQIVDNEKTVEQLAKKLAVKSNAFEANRPEFERRKADLLDRAQKLRNEIDMLLAGSDEYARVELGDFTLAPKPPSVPAEKKVAEPKPVEEKPSVLKELTEEAATQKNILVPYENQLRDASWNYWWNIIVGEEDRIRTPADAVEFIINK